MASRPGMASRACAIGQHSTAAASGPAPARRVGLRCGRDSHLSRSRSNDGHCAGSWSKEKDPVRGADPMMALRQRLARVDREHVDMLVAVALLIGIELECLLDRTARGAHLPLTMVAAALVVAPVA